MGLYPSTMTAVVRFARAEDVPGIVALLRDVLDEFELAFGAGSETDEQVQNLPASYAEHGGAFWVAESDTFELLGTCGIFPLGDETFELRKMYLNPRVRGRRIGKALFDVAVAWLRERNAKRIVLDTTEQMTAAIAFYEQNGPSRPRHHRNAGSAAAIRRALAERHQPEQHRTSRGLS